MKELIPMNDYGIFADGKDTARANSLIVAKMFGKQHKHVLDSLQKITQPKNGLNLLRVVLKVTRLLLDTLFMWSEL